MAAAAIGTREIFIGPGSTDTHVTMRQMTTKGWVATNLTSIEGAGAKADSPDDLVTHTRRVNQYMAAEGITRVYLHNAISYATKNYSNSVTPNQLVNINGVEFFQVDENTPVSDDTTGKNFTAMNRELQGKDRLMEKRNSKAGGAEKGGWAALKAKQNNCRVLDIGGNGAALVDGDGKATKILDKAADTDENGKYPSYAFNDLQTAGIEGETRDEKVTRYRTFITPFVDKAIESGLEAGDMVRQTGMSRNIRDPLVHTILREELDAKDLTLDVQYISIEEEGELIAQRMENMVFNRRPIESNMLMDKVKGAFANDNLAHKVQAFFFALVYVLGCLLLGLSAIIDYAVNVAPIETGRRELEAAKTAFHAM